MLRRSLLISITFFASLLLYADAAAATCCNACPVSRFKSLCADCTSTSGCCATGSCNIFCCDCGGHCRTGDCCNSETEAETTARAYERFLTIDSDRNGNLSKKEVKRWLKRSGGYSSKAAFDQGFSTTDESGNGEIELEEYDPDVATRYTKKEGC